MNKLKLTHILTSLIMMIIIISISVCAILFCKSIFNYDIDHLNVQDDLSWGVERIEKNYQYLKTLEDFNEEKYQSFLKNQPMSKEMLKHNYSVLIDYQSIFNHERLEFPNFPMSKSGEKHFREVKVVFGICEYIALIGGILGLAYSFYQYKVKDFLYFKYVSVVTFIVPLIIGALAAINFDKAFTIFHQIVFRNDDWLFDYLVDPIILALPEEFFMHCFIGIILGVWIICLIFYFISKHLEKKWRRGYYD